MNETKGKSQVKFKGKNQTTGPENHINKMFTQSVSGTIKKHPKNRTEIVTIENSEWEILMDFGE